MSSGLVTDDRFNKSPLTCFGDDGSCCCVHSPFVLDLFSAALPDPIETDAKLVDLGKIAPDKIT